MFTRQMFIRLQAAIEALSHQRLRGISTEEWGEIADLFGTVDLFDGPQIELPPTLSGWPERSEEKSGFKLQLKLDGRNRHFKEALLKAPDRNDDYFLGLLELEGRDLKREDPGGESPEEAPWRDQCLFDCGYCSIDLWKGYRCGE